MFFAIISLFAGAGLYAMEEPIWPAFVFSGLLATGLGQADPLTPGPGARP